MKRCLQFRPSSHSEDYTLVATYTNKAKAMKAYKALKRFLRRAEDDEGVKERDWSLDEAKVYLHNRKVLFSVYTSGCLDQIRAVLNTHHPIDLKEYKDYQEVEIRVKLPPGVTADIANLFLPKDQAVAFGKLKQLCSTKIRRNKRSTVFIFRYAGEEIYSEEDGVLCLDNCYPVDSWKNWETYLL